MAEVTGGTPGEKLHESLNCPNELHGYEDEHIFTLNSNHDSFINMNISSDNVDKISKEEIIEWLIDEYSSKT
jgi:FlaA1/EpsC-like NDP-sugar epimerase